MPNKRRRPNLEVAVAFLGGIEEFMTALNISRNTLYRWRKGITLILGERAIEIEKLTDGYVTRSNLRPDFWPQEDT